MCRCCVWGNALVDSGRQGEDGHQETPGLLPSPDHLVTCPSPGHLPLTWSHPLTWPSAPHLATCPSPGHLPLTRPPPLTWPPALRCCLACGLCSSLPVPSDLVAALGFTGLTQIASHHLGLAGLRMPPATCSLSTCFPSIQPGSCSRLVSGALAPHLGTILV